MSKNNKDRDIQNVLDILDTDNSFSYEDEEDIIQNEQNPIVDIDKILTSKNCICKIEVVINGKLSFGTGLFCYIPSKEIRVLITNNHIIDNNFLEKEKELIIYFEEKEYQKKIIINLKSDRFKFSDKNLDVTVIEIVDEDLIDNYFEVDEEKISNNEFLNESVVNLHFCQGEKLKMSLGKILKITKKGRFFYNAGTEHGSSGSPIILNNEFKVIGIHKGTIKQTINNNKINVGIYLEQIIKLIPKSSHLDNKNVIKCVYDIKKEDIDKDIKVFDNTNNIEENIKSISILREDQKKREVKGGKCRFEKEGKYIIFYALDNLAFNLSDMFNNCTNLIKVYMPSFIDNKILSMPRMFKECYSLENINFLSSFNTKNVKNISDMFSNCYSLKNMKLSSFKTSNVENMSGIFSGCKSLTSINLSSFNTEKVIDMSNMFNNCIKLKEINISSFNTRNVLDMSYMFKECRQLQKINLKSFNTESVKDLSNMFDSCTSIKELDLSGFSFDNITKMKEMFKLCKDLKEINLPKFHINKNTMILDMFFGCDSLISIKDCFDDEILKEYKMRLKKF